MADAVGEIVIRNSDVEPLLDFRVAQALNGTPVVSATLGSTSEDVKAAIMEVLPKILADKVTRIIPPDFVLDELAFVMKVSGTLGIASIDGNVTIKLKPRR